jgi:hypothetical protein
MILVTANEFVSIDDAKLGGRKNTSRLLFGYFRLYSFVNV